MSYSKRSIVNESFEKMASKTNIVNVPFDEFTVVTELSIPDKEAPTPSSSPLITSNDFVALLSEEYNRSKEATRRADVGPVR